MKNNYNSVGLALGTAMLTTFAEPSESAVLHPLIDNHPGAPVVQTFYPGSEVSMQSTSNAHFCVVGTTFADSTYTYGEETVKIAQQRKPAGFEIHYDLPSQDPHSFTLHLKANPQGPVQMTFEDGSSISLSELAPSRDAIFITSDNEHFSRIVSALEKGQNIVLDWDSELEHVQDVAALNNSANTPALSECFNDADTAPFATQLDAFRSISIELPEDASPLATHKKFEDIPYNQRDYYGDVYSAQGGVIDAQITRITGGTTIQHSAFIGMDRNGLAQSFAVTGCFVLKDGDGLMSMAMDTNMPGKPPIANNCADTETPFNIARTQEEKIVTWAETRESLIAVYTDDWSATNLVEPSTFYNNNLSIGSGETFSSGFGNSIVHGGNTFTQGDTIINWDDSSSIIIGDCNAFGDNNILCNNNNNSTITPDHPSSVAPVPVPPALLLLFSAMAGLGFVSRRKAEKAVAPENTSPDMTPA